MLYRNRPRMVSLTQQGKCLMDKIVSVDIFCKEFIETNSLQRAHNCLMILARTMMIRNTRNGSSQSTIYSLKSRYNLSGISCLASFREILLLIARGGFTHLGALSGGSKQGRQSPQKTPKCDNIKKHCSHKYEYQLDNPEFVKDSFSSVLLYGSQYINVIVFIVFV